jgi:DNA polymerase V
MLFENLSEALAGFQPGAELASLAHTQRLALVDCNQFYVSCERLFRPDLQGIPVVVLSNNDGCVIALSLEARELGIEMGQPWFEVQQIFVRKLPVSFSSNYTLYEAVSERVMASLRSLGLEIEVYSIDEAFVQLPKDHSAELQAEIMVSRVKRWTGIPVSAGIGSTKALAKVATWLAKKRYHRPWYVLSDLAELADVPIQALWGIGTRHAARLQERKVFTAADFIQQDPSWIRKHMTVQGLRLYLELQGIACFPLQTKGRRSRQIRHARSLAYDESNLKRLHAWLAGFVVQAAIKLRNQDCVAGKLGVFLLSNRFRTPDQPGHSAQAFISCRLESATSFTPVLLRTARALLGQLYRPGIRYKKLGVLLQEVQPSQESSLSWLWPDWERETVMMASIDSLNQRLGYQAVIYASQLGAGAYSKQAKRSPRYLTRWDELPEIRKRR